MEFLQGFNAIMESSAHIALATSKDNAPNVRLVSYYYDIQNKGIVYVSTFKQSPKTMEFSENNKVAFTTIPEETDRVVRVTTATVKKSELTVYDLKDGFAKNNPNFEFIIKNAGPMFEVYELHFDEALVTLGPQQTDKITLSVKE